ncbi:Nucleoside phosphatase GDA1/CD39 [Macleaya cordata]|uniref:Nucleoside phosphatase GDA1/CD39 n=1 Tax=Macleaya cordata TaxID=56857 RepID=A0A200PX71_MACCD|nr:Nucleoside phosphatase GDA1/CD39 [Macleaya cordata]
MAFSRSTEFFSATDNRITGSHSTAGPSISSGALSRVGPGHGLGFANPRQKNNLRISSSLQDFSTYRQLDPEQGDIDIEFDQSTTTHTELHRSLQRENGSASFSKHKTIPGIPFIRNKLVRAMMVVLCLVLFVFLIFLCARYFSNFWSQNASQFYVVLDCGSTGTRVYVYESSINHKKDESLPIVVRSLPEGLQSKSSSSSGRAYQRMETDPGLDKLVNNISGLSEAINPLLWWAEKQIPKHAHKSTSVFLYATGGVRRLPNSDSEWLLDNAWSILNNSSFLCHRDWVKIITGTEEAYYGWIALNYHMGMLGSTPGKETFGALDLGGSSLQVTFETKELVHEETSLNLSIGAVNHHLSAYSLSGYGLNDAFDKSVVHLIKRLPGITNVDLINGNIKLKHPCLQSGYREKYLCTQCSSLNVEGGSPVIGESNMGRGGKRGITVELLGAPHWEECSALAKVTVNLSEWSGVKPGIDCELQPCALTDGLPHPHGQFYAISGFFVVFRFFNLTSKPTLDNVLQKGQEFCEQIWEVAKNSVPPQPFIEQYCFRAPYIVSLLREGLHIMDSQVIIGSGSITWTLGVALLNTGGALSTAMELHSYRILQMKMDPIILYVVLFMSLILLVCTLSCLGNWMPRFFRRPYLPLLRHNSSTVTSVINIPSPFRFKHWSPISSGDGRVKTPLSPTIAGSGQRPFSTGHGLGGIQLTDSFEHPSGVGVSHSYSSGSLGQMLFENNGIGSFWSPHRSQMRLQSRRSQSREDLISSLAEAHMGKV